MTNNHGFELLKEETISEINTIGRLYKHIQSGAQLLSLINDDENKVFAISFRTPPIDSTGIAHIMEHSVLCGSKKYPLKEPFVELEKGSLRTFLNAFTFPDKTCYPIASQNLQDFYNLIDVYVDAVFHPLIPANILQQEGWHFELEELEQPLSIKGVVYNEMKGAYSSPDGTLARISRQSLFPDNTYGVDFGGDPGEITKLNYENFKSFHQNYYHPANAYIYFYGDDDPETQLNRMDNYLNKFNRINIDSSIKLQPQKTDSRRIVKSFDPGEAKDGNKGMITVNWLLPFEASKAEPLSPEMALGWSILAHILIATQASPLRRALVDSGLGEDLVGVGFDGQLLQPYFSIGLKGLANLEAESETQPGDTEIVEQVESIIFNTLQELVKKGIDPDTVAAAVNTVEFRLRENNTGSFPRGLLLMLRALTTWLYDGDPFSRLKYELPLRTIKERIKKDSHYFENLIWDHLIENPHRTTVILQPEIGLQQRLDTKQVEDLRMLKRGMSEKELIDIIEDTRRLKEIQSEPDPPERLALIPSLTLADLDRKIKRIPLDLDLHAGTQILYHDLFTNGIVYLDIGFDLHYLAQDLLPYVPLFGRTLFEMGTDREDFVKLSQRIGRTTGGIYPTTFTSPVWEQDSSTTWLLLRGKATMSQTPDLFAILLDVLLNVCLDDKERFRQIVLEEKAAVESSLIPAGHQYVNARIRAQFEEAGWVAELMGGLSYLFFLRELIKRIDSDWPSVQNDLNHLRDALVHKNSMLTNITLDANNWARVKPELSAFISQLPEKQNARNEWDPKLEQRNEGFIIPAQVNCVGKGGALYDLGYQLDGSVSVIINFLRTTWIWEQVRVTGGAYGGFCNFNHWSGIFTYLSYRDPNLIETLEIFDQSAGFLSDIDESRLSQGELTKSIIGAIGKIDAYQLPDAKGFTSMIRYLTNNTDEFRQRIRNELLDSKLEDFKAFGGVLDRLSKKGSVVVVGSENKIQLANEQLGNKLKITKVL